MEKNCCSEIEVLKNEMKHLKIVVNELKNERQLLSDSLVAMKENIVRLTVLSEKQDERLDRQDKKLDEFYESIDSKITEIKKEMKKNEKQPNVFNGNVWQLTRTLLVAILILIGFMLGKVDFDLSQLLQ